jgi:ABC-type dipeptide/oligopeptide/nickel transport system ATPase component
MNRKEAVDQVSCILERVSIRKPKRVLKAYPFTLSGGMRQRIMIAMAVSGFR